MMRRKIAFFISLLALAYVFSQTADAADLPTKISAVAVYYNLDPELFNAILAVESGHDQAAVNHKTKDYGIGQININTARRYGLDLQRLKTDVNYNLAASAKILSDFQSKYQAKEPQSWFCRYNIGTRLNGAKSRACLKYVQKVNAKLRSIAGDL